MLRGILVLCLIAGTQQLGFKEFSVPRSVELGTDVELKCQPDLKSNEQIQGLVVKWWRKDKNAPPKQLYQRVAYKGNNIQRNIKTVPGHEDNIIILNAQANDSAVYECELSLNIEEERQSLELYVYSQGTGPNITFYDANDPENVTISCKAEDVTPQPELTIVVDSVNLNVTTTAHSIENGFYTIEANATVSKTMLQDSEVSCELFYVNKTVAHPQYKYTRVYTEYEGDLGVGGTTTEEPVDDTTDSGPALRSMWVLIFSTVISTRFYV